MRRRRHPPQAIFQAGAARVVVPVRAGYEDIVGRYLESSEIPRLPPVSWREVRRNPYPPIEDLISDALERPVGEVAVGDPWEVVDADVARLPARRPQAEPRAGGTACVSRTKNLAVVRASARSTRWEVKRSPPETARSTECHDTRHRWKDRRSLSLSATSAARQPGPPPQLGTVPDRRDRRFRETVDGAHTTLPLRPNARDRAAVPCPVAPPDLFLPLRRHRRPGLSLRQVRYSAAYEEPRGL